MNIADRLNATYDITNVYIHHYKANGFGGRCFGEITKYSTKTLATGYDLVDSIRIAQNHVNRIQEAIDNMTRILNEAEPVKEENEHD